MPLSTRMKLPYEDNGANTFLAREFGKVERKIRNARFQNRLITPIKSLSRPKKEYPFVGKARKSKIVLKNLPHQEPRNWDQTGIFGLTRIPGNFGTLRGLPAKTFCPRLTAERNAISHQVKSNINLIEFLIFFLITIFLNENLHTIADANALS